MKHDRESIKRCLIAGNIKGNSVFLLNLKNRLCYKSTFIYLIYFSKILKLINEINNLKGNNLF